MTKEELEQIYYLNREQKLWEDELNRIRARSLAGSPMSDGTHGGNVSSKVERRAERVIELENRIAAKREEVQQLRDRAIAYITTIPDSLTRMIIYYRCVSLFGWRRVAYEVGGKNTEESVKKIYQRFFKRDSASCPECPE